MDTRRWQKLEQLFHATRQLDREERLAFVEHSCGGDAELEAELRSLLAANPAADERISGAVIEALEAIDGGIEGRELGPYRIVRKLGEGGLATVYLAERSDRQYRMQVAVKVVKPGMSTADILRRLRQERQILATLKHPNIAQLLDGGTTGEGSPYFVMEYIDGEPIDRYCDRRRLTIDQRLELFRTVCSAVHHAHRNLVIHRDIKPSNLLVSADGVPKLLDFGIAKLLRPRSGVPVPSGDSMAHTATGLRLLTPEYASPEQVRGELLTTATDVYSLGVLLYLLLCGRRPYRLDGVRPQDVERLICDRDPPRPSTAVGHRGAVPAGGDDGSADPGAEAVARARRETPGKLCRRLAGDLDNIVLMALSKEPQRRYASVDQLSADVGRYLAARPVVARGDSFAYRAARFFQRHRGAVIAAAALVVALLGGILATTRATLVANAQRSRAERHLAEAQQVTRFLIELFEISDPGEAQGNQVTAREILDEGARRIAFELGDQPVLRAELMGTMGRVYQNLGLLPRARELLVEALEERRRSLGAEHPEVAVGLGEVASVLAAGGDYATARRMLEEALGMQRRLLGAEHPEIAATVDLLAEVVLEQGDAERAEELYRQALAMRRELLGEDHPDTLESLNNLAEALFVRHDLDGAEGLFRQALERRRETLGELHPKVALTLNNLAVVLDARGDTTGAEEVIREALALRERVYGGEHSAVALGYNNLAAILQAQGKNAEAETWLRRALAMYRRLLGAEHPEVAVTMSNLALTLGRLGRAAEAEEMFLDTLALRRRSLGDGHPDVAQDLFHLAALRSQQGRVADAEGLLEEALGVQRRALSTGDYRLTYPLLLLGELLAGRGDCPAALPLLREAVEIRRQLAPEHPDRVAAEESLGRCEAG